MSGDEMIETLLESLKASNNPWNAWELEFIESLEGWEYERLSPKRKAKVEELWEKL